MENNEIIQEISIGVAVVLISTAILHIKSIWEKARQCYHDWQKDNEVLRLLGKSIGYTPWTAKRRVIEAWKETQKAIQAEKLPWLKTPEERMRDRS